MPYTVKFDPTTNSKQAQVIPNASASNDGVMTRAQASDLDTILGSFVVASSTVTTNATPAVADTFAMPQDGVASAILNITAANADGSDWAIFLVAALVAVSASGVVSIFAPVGPQAPAAQAGATSATWTVQGVAGTNAFDIQVKGAVGVTVKWNSVLFVNYNVR